MSIYAWFAIILITITLGFVIYFVRHYNMEIGEIFIVFTLGALMQATISSSLMSNDPTPIDVYRGKTTLKISYVDTIPQDTLVIWKTEFKN
jgi:TctA family transporter